jgi:MFS family permease
MTKQHNLVGILCIISGVLGVFYGTVLVIIGTVYSSIFASVRPNIYQPTAYQSFYGLFVWIPMTLGIACLILGVFAVFGGIYTIRKLKWGWVLAIVIASTIVFFPTGIAALVVLQKTEPEQGLLE